MMPKVTRYRLEISTLLVLSLGEALIIHLTANSRTDIGTQIVTISLGEGTVNNNYSITANRYR